MSTQSLDLVASRLRNRFYVFARGHIFASAAMQSESAKFGASLLLSAQGEPFVVEAEGCAYRGVAMLVRPEATRRVDARGTPLLSVGLSAAHPLFRHFSMLADPEPVRQLPAGLFAAHQEAIDAACEGQLSAAGAQHLGMGLMSRAAQTLPEPKPLDARIARALALIERGPAQGMEQLATELDISYHRLSHLFSESMGITLRSYVLARKVDLAAGMAGRGLSLTEIAFAAGFADSAHFSKIWLRASGAAPSRFFGGGDVGVTSVFQSR